MRLAKTMAQAARRRVGVGAGTLLAAFLLSAGMTATPAAAQALADRGTQEEQQACMPDVFRLCGAEIPNETRIVACLVAQRRSLNPACRKVMDSRQTSASAAARPGRSTAQRRAATRKQGKSAKKRSSARRATASRSKTSR